MAERVRITDVSPRDGLQNEPGVIPTTEKVRLVELLCATGVDEIEVTSFVSPRWVPQLGDAAEVCAGLSDSPSLREGAGGREAAAGNPARNLKAVRQAQALRRAMTGPEKQLWAHLSGKKLKGYKFRRQHPFGPFILDFYCPSERLVVELDGVTHAGEVARLRDAERTRYLEQHGLRVVRYSDDATIQNTAGVVESIYQHLRARPTLAPFPQPPPSGRGSGPGPVPLFSVLVPNERGFQGVLDVNRQAQRRLIRKVSVFTAASETFSRRNTNASIAETIQRFRPVVAAAHAEGLEIRGYISCAIACPFEGAIQPAAVVRVAKELMGLGIREIDLGDTIGAGTRESTATLLREYGREIPIERGHTMTTLHLHDTFGRAADCVKTALDLGVRSFDGSVAGLGGCPYASTPGKRAPGNISTELLVRTIEDAGYQTGLDMDALTEAAAYAREIVAKSRAGAAGSSGGTPA